MMNKESEFWNKRYSVSEYVYGEGPNIFLKEQLKMLPVGSILFVGEGEGRNSVYAAKQGWKVSAFDISVEGKRKAERLAHKHNVEIDYRVGELHDLDYGKKQYDVIALIFTHFPSKSRAVIHKELSRYLRPGGTLIMEVFSIEQINYQVNGNSGGGPKNIDMLYTLEDIQSDFENFEIIELEETEKRLREGGFHNGLSCVIRFVGVKIE
ncbi:MAG: class I SAM-dependent methyltransferase [Bacteroidales bacterium]|nr:class I SAM-dependent methyltransferase [Bacteroidales bacterium]